MAVTVTHTFVSPIVDGGDPDLVGPDEWNAAHTVSGLGTSATIDIDTDGTLAANSDAKIATQKATKTYADTKLDASSYTAADVLSKIETVDGTGSGLDADLLDGVHASALAALSGAAFTGAITITASNPYIGMNDSDTGAQAFFGGNFTTGSMGYWADYNNGVAGSLHMWSIDSSSDGNVMRLSPTALYPTTDDGVALGILSTNNWSDLYLASGGTINYANSNVVVTHSSGILTIGTGTLKITTPTNTSTSVVTIDGTQTLTNKSIVATQITAGTLNIGNNAFTCGTVELANGTANTLGASGGHMTIEGATVWDSGNDGSGSGLDADLLDGKNTGTSGNVVPLLDGNNTHSGTLNLSGKFATTAPQPSSNDGLALGVAATGEWSDLFLASGGVINWNNGDVLATHSANALAFTGGTYSFDGAVTVAGTAASFFGFTVSTTDAGASGPILNIFHDSASPAVSDIVGRVRFTGNDDGAAQEVYADFRAVITDPAAGSEDSEFQIFTDQAGTLTKQLTISSAGLNVAAGNIIFPAAQNASAGANTLDDYEEGTFTATILQTGVAPTTLTYTTQVGTYTKVGRLVTYNYNVVVNAFTIGSGTGNITLATLPFTSGQVASAVSCITSGVDWATGSQAYGTIASSATAIALTTNGDNIATGAVALSGLAAGDTISSTGHYYA